MLKKLSLLLLVVISALLVLAACGETPAPNATTTGNILPPTSATNPSPTFPSSLPDYDGPKEVPAYAKDAIKWEATIMGGFVVLDSDYRIVIEDGNEAASAAALYLRMSLKTALGANFTTVTDRIVAGSSTYVEKDKEILVGSVNNRYLADVAFADNEEFLSKYTSKVGAFYIGVSEQKIMILTMDDESIPVAVRFFAEHYVANQTYVEVDGDLSSLYLYDKNEYASSGEISFYSLQELKSKADVVSISLDGKTYASFDAGVKDYTQSIQLSQSAPVITIEPFSPFTNVSIVQATDENGLVSTISVRSDDGTVSNVYKVQFNRLPYDIVDSTLHALKDGARGAITIVQDDG